MPDFPARPILLLAFANDRAGADPRYLMLPEEKRQLCQVLERATWDGIEVVVESNATPERLFDMLGDYNDRIIALHFGGHATAEGLALEDDGGHPRLLHHEGLARRLGGLPSLRLVFLNGCGTGPYVDAIHSHSPVAVVATASAIVDHLAVRFARRFYHAIARRASIVDAFEQAESDLVGMGADAGPWSRPSATVDGAFTRFLRPASSDDRPCPWLLAMPPARPDAGRLTLYPDGEAPQTIDRPSRWLLAIGLTIATIAVVWSVYGTRATSTGAGEPSRAGAGADLSVDAANGSSASAGAGEARPADGSLRRTPAIAPYPQLPTQTPPTQAATDFRPAAALLPATTGMIGHPGDGPAPPHDTRPRAATMSEIWMSVTPVTRGQWHRTMGHLPPRETFVGGAASMPSDDVPVTWITFDDALVYCHRLSDLEGLAGRHRWRLPTEVEWELACRAGEAADGPPELAGRHDRLPSVGGPANAWALTDLLGVVHQWTTTVEGETRVIRGGHHQTARTRLRCSQRWREQPDLRSGTIGLRIVRSPD